MSRIALFAAGLLATLALAAPLGAATSVTKLTGTVGPGFTITLKKGTTKVKTLKPGTYKITVNDKSNIHDFHLTGPGRQQDDHDDLVQGHEDGHREAEEGQVHLPV